MNNKKIVGNVVGVPNPKPDVYSKDEINIKLSEFENELEETTSIAKGANQAISFKNYEEFIEEFNEVIQYTYNVGQNIMIETLEVPDLWLSSNDEMYEPYSYTSDEAFVEELKANGSVHVGFYKVSQLETQKVNLEEYVKYDKTKEDTFDELSFWHSTSSFSYCVQFDDYETCVCWLNEQSIAPPTFYCDNDDAFLSQGQYISILDANLPDLIIIAEGYASKKYEFKSNEEFMNDIKENGFVQVGEFKIRLAGLKNYNMSTGNIQREYELIKTIEITEDIPTADEDGTTIPLTFDLDDNGNPFKLDYFIIIISCPEKPTYSSNWRCDVNKYPYSVISTPCNVGKNFKVQSERIVKGYWQTVKAARFNDDLTASTATLTFGAALADVDYAEAFVFRMNSAPVGTTVKIYGRRVSE